MACQGFPECSVACSCDEAPDYALCAHCRAGLDGATLVETPAGLDVCSTLCAVALCTFNHAEGCQRPECSDRAALTLPQMLCCYCDGESETTAHPECRAKVRRALALQDGARAGAVA